MDKSKTPQLPDPKLALITPSASPPHTRPFFPQPYRIPDQASPTKRPRLSSAPRQLKPPVSASSSSTSVDVVDFQKAREESTMRLLDVWAGLAERYSRALDEDDIIDITTGNVVKDRGVIRGPQTWNEGAFTEATQDEDEEEEEEDEVDEDEVDELDTLANPGLSSQEAEGRRVPPVREMDPYDARDLKEFLEAEQRRREIYGSEVDDTDGSVVEDAYTEEIRQGAPVNGSLYDDATRDEEEDGNPRQDIDEEATQRRVKPIYIDSGSDDELGNWECDEASIVYRLPKSEVAEDSDSEIEFVEPPMKARSLSPEVPFPSPRKPEKSNPVPAQRQLQTPPRSQSSSIPSATPDDYFIQLPPSSPPQSSSPPSSRCESSPIKPKPGKRSLSKPRSEQKRVHPLHTTFGDPIPRLDLKKVSRDRQGKTKVPQPRTPARTPQASNSASFYSHTQTTSKKPVPAPQSRRTKTPQRIVEAFIEQHPREETIKSVSSSQPRVQDVPTEQVENRRKKVVAVKAKGKKKVVSVDAEEIFEDDSNSRRSSPIGRRGTPRLQNLAVQQSASTLTSKDTEDQHTGSTGTKSKYGPMGTCSTSSGTIGRKRKRVVSAAEVGEEVPPPIADIQPSSSSASTSRARYLSMDSESVEPESSKVGETEIKQKQKRNPSSKPRKKSPEHETSNSSQDEFNDQQQQYIHATSHFEHPYYPYPQPSYPHPHPQDQQHMYGPIPDPRAQFIITQAMHQLSALVGGAWGPPPPPSGVVRGSTPYTPTHHRYPTNHPGLLYSTPTHHPHPYPFAYDPTLSRATMPPDSPETRSSSPSIESSGSGRRKSLVRRSQSRGRRVSFRIEEGVVDTMEMGTEKNGRSRERTSKMPQNSRKGKEKAQQDTSGSDEEEGVERPSRGRSSTRGQTPGPPAQIRSALQKTPVGGQRKRPG